MELDYYDYNVVNAGAAPGSYLGMDPAYCIWIPPIDDLEFDDIKPKQFIDPGSNQESPEEEVLLPKLRRKSIGEIITVEKNLLDEKKSPEGRRKSVEAIFCKDISKGKKNSEKEKKGQEPKDNKFLNKISITKKIPSIEKLDFNLQKLEKPQTPVLSRKVYDKIPRKSFPRLNEIGEFEKLGINSPARVHKVGEKEVDVEKSPSFDLDDIKFADDEGDDNECNISYQDSNIIVNDS